MYARHIAGSMSALAMSTLILAGAWIPVATRAQGEPTIAATPESDSPSGELREIEVFAPRLVEGYRIAVPVQSSNRLEEVTVRGQRSLTAYRLEAVAARERVWEVFNEINSDDQFDISCSRRVRTGTRIPKRVCRPAYADYATSQAGKEFLRRMQINCPPPPSPACLARAYAEGMAAAQLYIGQIAHMDRRLDEEAQRLARENLQFATAILEHQEKQREYQDARQRR